MANAAENVGFLVDLINHDVRTSTAMVTETALKLQYPMYNLFIEFPTAPIREKEKLKGNTGDADYAIERMFKGVVFSAYINGQVSDTFTPSYNDAGPVFGRMDPIPVYQRTTRAIKVDFHIPAFDIEDARRIRGKLDIVAKNTYPTYTSGGGNRLVIKKPPLIRIKFGNIICNPIDQFRGLLGYLTNGITISHDLSGGSFTEWPGQEIYAKKYSLSLSMSVLHEFTPGFTESDIPGVPDFTSQKAILSFPGSYQNRADDVKSFTTEKNKNSKIKLAEQALFGDGGFGLGG